MSFMQDSPRCEKRLDWEATQRKAKDMSRAELLGAMRDCQRCIEKGVDAGYYRDELSVYQKELRRRYN